VQKCYEFAGFARNSAMLLRLRCSLTVGCLQSYLKSARLWQGPSSWDSPNDRQIIREISRARRAEPKRKERETEACPPIHFAAASRVRPGEGEAKLTLQPLKGADAIGTPYARSNAQAYRLGGGAMFVLCFLFASFSYELPLVYITSRYRLNPRIFDVAALMLIFYWLLIGNSRGWRVNLSHPLLKPWLTLVSVFIMMAAITVLFVPLDLFRYSARFAFRYVLASIVLLIVLSAPLAESQKRRLLWVALLGGTWVSFYGVLQMLGVASAARILPSGDFTEVAVGAITSTLGPSYFHAGQFGILSGLIGLTLFRCSTGFPRTIAGVLGVFSMIPAVASGSRAGFVGLLIALVVLGSQREYRKYVTSFLMGGLVAVVVGLAYSGSLTESRITRHSASTQEKTEVSWVRGQQFIRTFVLVEETVGPRLWMFGGGFYVTPIGDRHRVGYGVHNIFFFPLEQAGVLGFAASIWIWITLWKGLRPRRNRPPENLTDTYLRVAMFSYLAALGIIGWAGQIFWLGFGNEILGTYQFLLFGLAMMPSRTQEADSPAVARGISDELTSPYLLSSPDPALESRS